MQVRRAERKKAKLRLGMSGPSGSGKTLSALLMAYGITDDWEKIGFIDTEQRSGDLYAETEKAGVWIGQFLKIDLDPPYEPEKYIQAIRLLEQEGCEVIIIDSLTHAWAGDGGILDIHGKIADSGKGNSFTAWRTVTPRHNALVDAMLQSPCHIIATVRAKTEYVQQTNEKGKAEIKKVGMAPIQRDGMEYEFTVFLDLSHDHIATASKDRTSIFDGKYFRITPETGKQLLQWLEMGKDVPDPRKLQAEKLETVKSLWTELSGSVETFAPWLKEKRHKEPEQLTLADLESLEAMFQRKLQERSESA